MRDIFIQDNRKQTLNCYLSALIPHTNLLLTFMRQAANVLYKEQSNKKSEECLADLPASPISIKNIKQSKNIIPCSPLSCHLAIKAHKLGAPHSSYRRSAWLFITSIFVTITV